MRRSKAKSSPRTDKKKLPLKGQKASKKDREIDDLLALAGQGDLSQVIYIGQVVEDALTGEFGSILRALLRGRQAMELAESRVQGGTISAERFLGRLDAYERILNDLEQYVVDKEKAKLNILDIEKQRKPVELHTAPELGQEGEEQVHA